MNESQGAESSNENVADNWEEAGDEVSVQLEQRQKLLIKKKKKEEEQAKARQEAAMLSQMNYEECCSTGEEKPTTFKILRRPQSYGILPSSLRTVTANSSEEQWAQKKSLEERQAAYQQARERIFGGQYNPDEEPDPEELVSTIISLPPTTTNSPTGILQPRAPFYSFPIPRPRAAAPVVHPHFQAIPASQGVAFAVPPPIPVYASVQRQHKVPLGSAIGQTTQPVAFFDASVPPPIPAMSAMYPAVMVSSNVSSNETTDQSKGVACNSVPYGRPPAQLLAQTQFSAVYNSTNPNF